MVLASLRNRVSKSYLGRRVRHTRRKIYEFLGNDRYSRPALYRIDHKLEAYLPHRNGVFIEAGANDGFTQSNTYYFEMLKGWTGVLVEPVPALFKKCCRERPNSAVFPYALISGDDDRMTVPMTCANLMSLVHGARKTEFADREHIRRGAAIQELTPYEIEVPARTLSSIIDEAGLETIDLLSLDVEGYELSVLEGLDLERHAPKYILIEATFRADIENYLAGKYEPIDELSHHDVLFRKI